MKQRLLGLFSGFPSRRFPAEVAEALYRLNRGPQASLAGLCQGLDRAHALWSGEPERAITRQELARTLHR